MHLRAHYLGEAGGAPSVRALPASFHHRPAAEVYVRAGCITLGNAHTQRWQKRCCGDRAKLRTVWAPSSGCGSPRVGRPRLAVAALGTLAVALGPREALGRGPLRAASSATSAATREPVRVPSTPQPRGPTPRAPLIPRHHLSSHGTTFEGDRQMITSRTGESAPGAAR